MALRGRGQEAKRKTEVRGGGGRLAPAVLLLPYPGHGELVHYLTLLSKGLCFIN